ncbi:hypothetical protein Psuf_018240 [Phytohabitans suffuscus]|uniref:Uncharacterized protein n=1 Tax=Phytohabitans suffuscus TaxID=624315 RepID=A0A6F8YEY4_9ACTN|nr:hypothetical protein [Phytohabitans suffuscus]BCB84511.1 hypothetical protein Psuf_018240 [Phytohabitans suffuscus]
MAGGTPAADGTAVTGVTVVDAAGGARGSAPARDGRGARGRRLCPPRGPARTAGEVTARK